MELKKIYKSLERSLFLELKSFAGHIRRIALVSTESKHGMQLLVKRTSSIIGALIFEPRISIGEEDRVYNASPSTILIPEIIQEEGTANQAKAKILNTHTRQSSQNFPSREEVFRASLASLNDKPRGLVLETDQELSQSWKGFTNIYMETVLLESGGPLNWYSKAIDLTVRYFDFIFKVSVDTQ